MQDNFHLLNRSVRHAPQNQENTLQALCALLRTNNAYELKDGRKSYELTDHVREGIYKLQSTASASILQPGGDDDAAAEADGETAGADDEPEVEIDDLEVE